MHIQTDLLEAEAERTAGILEDRHAAGLHPTVEARQLAEAVISLFERDSRSLWDCVSDSLYANPIRLDWIARDHGLPRPTDAVKATTIGLVRSKGLAATLSPIPAAADRPVCVLVGWLAEHPTFAAQLEYLDGDNGWRPATEAVRGIDNEWPVEVRQAMHVVGA